MLALRPNVPFARCSGQAAEEVVARLGRVNDGVYIAELGRDVRVGEFFGVTAGDFLALRLRVGGHLNLAFEDDVTSTFGAHDGDLGPWPGEVEVGADVL